MNTMMNLNRKPKVADLNPNLLCVLCGGYYVDATTIIECLHSFCKACIVRYLETNKYCPICDVQVHKTKPLQNIRADETLQTIVYKLVPGLYQNEMLRRREFYAHHPNTTPASTEDGGSASEKFVIYTPDESICLSLEYLNSPKEISKDSFSRRFLRCPAAVTVSHLQKLIRAKFGLSSEHRVDIIYMEDLLHESLTLMDIAYIYSWRRKDPFHLRYCILENRIKRRKFDHNPSVKNCCVDIDGSNSSKSYDDGLGDNVQIVLNAHGLEKVNTPYLNNLKADLKDESRNRWKEVQIQISENGIMSVTDISMEHNNNNHTDLPEEFQVSVQKDQSVPMCCGTVYGAESKPNVCEENHIKSERTSVSLKYYKEEECDYKFAVKQENPPVISDVHGVSIQEVKDTKVKYFASEIQDSVDNVSDRESKLTENSGNSALACVVTSPSLYSHDSKHANALSSLRQKELSTVKAFNSEAKSLKKDATNGADPNLSNECTSVSSFSFGKHIRHQVPMVADDFKSSQCASKSWNVSKVPSSPVITKTSVSEKTTTSVKVSLECGKSSSSASKKNMALKQLAENLNSSAKPLCVVRARNVPRYLGNPASGVKPMFQPVTVAHIQSPKPDIDSKYVPSSLKTSSVTVTKIDPKTLSPIVDSCNPSAVNASPLTTASSSSITLPTSYSSAAPNVRTCRSYPVPQNSFNSSTKGHNIVNQLSTPMPFPRIKEDSSKAHCTVSDKAWQGMLGNTPQASCSSFVPNIPKNAHLLYVFSGSNRMSSPLRPIGPHILGPGMGAFHPLPPSVNMLFNPHLQHHRLQNQCTVGHPMSMSSTQRAQPQHSQQKLVSEGSINSSSTTSTSDSQLFGMKEGSNKKLSEPNFISGTNSNNVSSENVVCDKNIKNRKDDIQTSSSSVFVTNPVFSNHKLCNAVEDVTHSVSHHNKSCCARTAGISTVSSSNKSTCCSNKTTPCYSNANITSVTSGSSFSRVNKQNIKNSSLLASPLNTTSTLTVSNDHFSSPITSTLSSNPVLTKSTPASLDLIKTPVSNFTAAKISLPSTVVPSKGVVSSNSRNSHIVASNNISFSSASSASTSNSTSILSLPSSTTIASTHTLTTFSTTNSPSFMVSSKSTPSTIVTSDSCPSPELGATTCIHSVASMIGVDSRISNVYCGPPGAITTSVGISTACTTTTRATFHPICSLQALSSSLISRTLPTNIPENRTNVSNVSSPGFVCTMGDNSVTSSLSTSTVASTSSEGILPFPFPCRSSFSPSISHSPTPTSASSTCIAPVVYTDSPANVSSTQFIERFSDFLGKAPSLNKFSASFDGPLPNMSTTLPSLTSINRPSTNENRRTLTKFPFSGGSSSNNDISVGLIASRISRGATAPVSPANTTEIDSVAMKEDISIVSSHNSSCPGTRSVASGLSVPTWAVVNPTSKSKPSVHSSVVAGITVAPQETNTKSLLSSECDDSEPTENSVRNKDFANKIVDQKQLDQASSGNICCPSIDKFSSPSDLYSQNKPKPNGSEGLTDISVDQADDQSSKENMCINNVDIKCMKPASQLNTCNISSLPITTESTSLVEDSISTEIQCNNNSSLLKSKETKKPLPRQIKE